MDMLTLELAEICEHCGYTKGSHLGTAYYSDHYAQFFPRDTCPGNEGRMNWDEGAGTVFKSTGEYKHDKGSSSNTISSW